jgi:hypothetical protein
MSRQAQAPADVQNRNGGAVPEFLRVVIADEKPASARAVAEKAVLDLNSSMMRLYDESLETFKRNMRDRVPIILALFSGQGGRMILYRPGHAPEAAPPVPIVYQLAKSVGHSSMAVYQIVAPYLADPQANLLWRGPLRAYRTEHQTALDGLGALDISEDDRAVLRAILERNLAFMDECLAAGTYTYEGLERFTRGCTPYAVKAIAIASAAQVGHWMQVLDGWRERLGAEWQRTYAVSNTLYVTRQNNILFSVLVQFMGTEAMGDRLLLVETPEFETTPEKLLDVLGRIVADRGLGMVFFRDYFLMDVELLGGAAGPRSRARWRSGGGRPCCRPWPRSAPTTGRGKPTRAGAPAPPASKTCRKGWPGRLRSMRDAEEVKT